MGCITSKTAYRNETKTIDSENNVGGSLDAVNATENTIEKTITAKFGCMNVRYGYLSQRGFYPEEPRKANQDSYSITKNMANEESDSLFAVYDGHGRYGDLCAQFARDRLPQLISKYSIKANKESQHKQMDDTSEVPTISKAKLEVACTSAHRQCNTAMHKDKSINDSLSGTTSISCLLHGNENRITVCNVGDSRAVLGQRITHRRNSSTSGDVFGDDIKNSENTAQDSYRALPLSSDQTPYRQDERKRIKATGARILSLDQLEGLEPIPDDDDDDGKNSVEDIRLGEQIDQSGDPPRVWSPDGDYPGTAFTRSFGDSIAEQFGVTAEPEIVSRDLLPEDRIIVLASDGVFEFLTNQSVIDICAKYEDPLEACRAVVAESYELWLQFELRTDDITIICIFIDSIGDLDTSQMTENDDTVTDSIKQKLIDSERPTRKWLSRSASKRMVDMKKRLIDETDEVAEDYDESRQYTEKTEAETICIRKAVDSIAMFKSLSNEQKNMLIKIMEPIIVEKGDWIIQQGTVGDQLFIAEDGTFEVRKVAEGENDDAGNGGNLVHSYVASRASDRLPAFGELALINSEPRLASIIAQTDGKLWALHRYDFRKVLAINEKK